MRYAIFFDKDGATYRLPTNPESIVVSSSKSSEKFSILKQGQIVVPSHADLKTYSFECEFPSTPYRYVTTPGDFKGADFYVNLFEKWMQDDKPFRLIASNGIGDDINTKVIFDNISIKEMAGEEGDKYISFELIEHRPYGKLLAVIKQPAGAIPTAKKTEVKAAQTNPKSGGSHTVVKGDTLWAIAKKHYGNGASYSKIYNANKNIIKNPNLIYPGQKLVIPK